MSEEQTERLNGENNFEARVLTGLAALNNRLTTELAAINDRLTVELGAVNNRLANVDERLTSLEEKVDSRLRETRPIWEGVLSQLKLIEAKLGVLAREWLDVRGEIDELKKGAPPAA